MWIEHGISVYNLNLYHVIKKYEDTKIVLILDKTCYNIDCESFTPTILKFDTMGERDHFYDKIKRLIND